MCRFVGREMSSHPLELLCWTLMNASQSINRTLYPYVTCYRTSTGADSPARYRPFSTEFFEVIRKFIDYIFSVSNRPFCLLDVYSFRFAVRANSIYYGQVYLSVKFRIIYEVTRKKIWFVFCTFVPLAVYFSMISFWMRGTSPERSVASCKPHPLL